jgi:rhodanese-related sulfurtransferase
VQADARSMTCVMDHSPGFLKLVAEVMPRVREIDNRAAADLAKSGEAVLIDVREESEWRAAHAAQAHYLGRGILERDVEKLVPDPDTPVILYCGGGYRSALAADNLQKMGYTNVRSMAGGFTGWKEAGLPTE